MSSNQTRCNRCVDEIRKMIKFGKTKSGNQRYICKLSRKTTVENYRYQAYKSVINQFIIQLTKEGFYCLQTLKLTTFLEFFSRA